MEDQIIELLKEKGINPQGTYSGLVGLIKDAIEFVKVFGYENWEQTTSTGKAIKEIVKKLS
jgi:hypothetical protein